MSTVYLIHFDQKLGHSQHYIGWAKMLEKRIAHHRAGNGARLMQVVTEAGIGWGVVRTWNNASRNFERRLKNCKKSSVLCPICNPDGWKKRMAEPF